MGGGGPRIGLPDGRLSPSAGERSNGNQTRTMRLLVEVTREGKRDADTGTFACGAAHLCDDRTVAVGLVIVVAAMCAVRNGEGGMIGAAWADSRVVAVHLRPSRRTNFRHRRWFTGSRFTQECGLRYKDNGHRDWHGALTRNDLMHS